jgi:hypothetical protein
LKDQRRLVPHGSTRDCGTVTPAEAARLSATLSQ